MYLFMNSIKKVELVLFTILINSCFIVFNEAISKSCMKDTCHVNNSEMDLRWSCDVGRTISGSRRVKRQQFNDHNSQAQEHVFGIKRQQFNNHNSQAQENVFDYGDYGTIKLDYMTNQNKEFSLDDFDFEQNANIPNVKSNAKFDSKNDVNEASPVRSNLRTKYNDRNNRRNKFEREKQVRFKAESSEYITPKELSCLSPNNTLTKVADICHDELESVYNIIGMMDLSRNSIKVLYRNDFIQYPCLRRLELQENGLKEIRSGAFTSLGQLRRLDLSNNKIEALWGSQFRGLKRLRRM